VTNLGLLSVLALTIIRSAQALGPAIFALIFVFTVASVPAAIFLFIVGGTAAALYLLSFVRLPDLSSNDSG
jgi:hypothetical protein